MIMLKSRQIIRMDIWQQITQPGTAKKWCFCIFLFLVAFILLFLVFQDRNDPWHLVVRAPKYDRMLYSIPVEGEDVFHMVYVHSVSGQRVEGSFKITDRGLIKPLTTEFDSFGPGLPVFDRSVEYEIKNGSFIVYHDEEPRQELSLFVAPLTGDQLLLHGEKYDLTSHYENPVLVQIYISGAE